MMGLPVIVEFLNIGGGEMTLIVIVILFFFGGKKLPELARGLGKGLREFKDASEGVKREIHRNINMEADEYAVNNYGGTGNGKPQYQNFHPSRQGRVDAPEAGEPAAPEIHIEKKN